MNFYAMDLNELDRIGRDAMLNDYEKAILEKGLDVNSELQALKEVLEERGLSINPNDLEIELSAMHHDYEFLLEEFNELKKEIEAKNDN
jgi:hypothetical protein